MKDLLCVMLCATFAVAGYVRAADRAELEGTTIRGNRELPKVLYIVPWKTAVTGALVGKPVASLLDEALAPVDRDVFRRQSEYYGLLHAGEAKVSPATK